MFWNRVLLPTYFAELYDNPTDAQNIQVRVCGHVVVKVPRSG